MVKQVALAFARSALESAGLQGEPTATVNEQDRSVTVAISAKVVLRFIRLGGTVGYGINSKAVARAGSSSVICLLALGDGSVNLGVSNGKVTANKCNTHSNSKASDGLVAEGLGTISSKVICTSGGYVGAKNAFDPAPATDCPVAADPLASRMAPSDGKCDFTISRSKSACRPFVRVSIAWSGNRQADPCADDAWDLCHEGWSIGAHEWGLAQHGRCRPSI